MELSMTVLRCPDQVAPETRTVPGGEYHVGRGPDVDWVLPDPDRLLSKRHFAVAFRGGAWQIADTSTNGTFLNTDAEALGRGTARTLRDGDRVRLGAYEIEVRLVDQPSQSSGFGGGMGMPVSHASSGHSPFGDPFGDDPLAPPPPPRRAFDEPSYGDLGMPGTSAQLPHDFDPLAPEHGDSGFESFRGPVQSDHSSAMDDAMIPPPITTYGAPASGGIIPTDDMLPDDWDKDLLEGIAPPGGQTADPFAQPSAPPPPPPPAPLAAAPPPPVTRHAGHVPEAAPPRDAAAAAFEPAPLSAAPAMPEDLLADFDDAGPFDTPAAAVATPPPDIAPMAPAVPPPSPASQSRAFEPLPDDDDLAPFDARPPAPPSAGTPPRAEMRFESPLAESPLAESPLAVAVPLAAAAAAAPVVRPRPPRPPAPPPSDANPFNEAGVDSPVESAPAAMASPPAPHAAANVASPFDEPADKAPPPAVAPRAAPAAPAPLDNASALAAFFQGAELSGAAPSDPMGMMKGLGAAFRAVVSGLRAVLIARATIKSEFRIEQTMIRAHGNNPLKFSANDDDALTALLGVGRRTDMSPAAAVEDLLRDIRMHEVATMAAMQVAVRSILEELSPDNIRAGTEQGGLAVLPAQRKARTWDVYESRHKATIQALSDDFDSVFGKAFARAYERALSEISSREQR